MVLSASSREGRCDPVNFKKCANKGSSITLKSDRCAKLYISAVLQLRGPDHNETFIRLAHYGNATVDAARCQFVNGVNVQHEHVHAVSHEVPPRLVLTNPRLFRIKGFKNHFAPAIHHDQVVGLRLEGVSNRQKGIIQPIIVRAESRRHINGKVYGSEVGHDFFIVFDLKRNARCFGTRVGIRICYFPMIKFPILHWRRFCIQYALQLQVLLPTRP